MLAKPGPSQSCSLPSAVIVPLGVWCGEELTGRFDVELSPWVKKRVERQKLKQKHGSVMAFCLAGMARGYYYYYYYYY